MKRQPTQVPGASARDMQFAVTDYWKNKCRELLQERNNLSREDLEYVAEKTAQLKDKRLADSIGTLIGWGDDDRAELETFCAISLELMKTATPSRFRDATRMVEIRYLSNQPKDGNV